MVIFTNQKEMRNKKRYISLLCNGIIETSNTENVVLQSVCKNASHTEPEPLVSKQDLVVEQLRTYNAWMSK